ncbi:S9 family peptidase [Sphingobacterium psychroaquaticum]|uniref:Dipeptidyl aminopeptidase/acylaminoacyl peptidase n=1 Tax=Sphingobacterium psychroaquaticum TaxID=561061 RepID=A0A1X7I4K9_9SPHI|nr:S9 family peptidase [Sphingobacterium psychroaquaticum]QBQ41921.1 S9 family peptidase [Sphingobacterium psychroaquaticum]SMG09375.1 Dipeptidyl aminopeptidase/acylaminoacyl peptidase [Sphingobacterium psychroaquaticum]
MFRTRFNILLCLALSVAQGFAQGTVDDYKRAKDLRGLISNKVYHAPSQIKWNESGDLLWYEKNTVHGKEFVLVDTKSKTKSELFQVTEVVEALKSDLKKDIDPRSIGGDRIKVIDRSTVELEAEGSVWSWDRSTKKITKKEGARDNRRGGYWGQRYDDSKGEPVESPDKSRVAFIKNSNLYVAPKGNLKAERQLTFDGSPGEYYAAHIQWSPDGKKIAASKVRKAEVRILTLLESSPGDQLQPKLQTRDYPKPGDALSQYYPVIYNLESNQLFACPTWLIENQFSIGRLEWRKDSRALTFEYNKRGHQQYAVVELDATQGRSRYLINETNKTFIDYSGKRYREDLQDGKEIIWASERDGWNHLYRYDGTTGAVINQITKGEWVVRKVVHVDETRKEIIFEGSGKNKDQDPYFIQYYSIGFDGQNLRELTRENGNHTAYFNNDHSYFVDTYSRIDEAPTTVLRDRSGKVIIDLEKADDQALKATGWKAPEVFTAKARDGKSDIWGIIIRPTNFDPQKKYPVIEYIYAGPHSSFVPKTFIPNPSGMQELAELGFIVVQIDGMGTSNRSKAFQDVCWKNLKDAGFPDRILWMKDAAKKYPYMDLEKVGIYGTSAGGQSSTAALLFHPEFYKVGVSSCGCHDNRMDKIWWNEQWMGWPIGPEYAACSNIDNADKLQGKLMLIVGELDDNVDPASTYQLTNALIKANKEHELIMVPGMGHSSGGDYGEKKRRDFFVKNLLEVNPPAWNAIP